LIAQVVVIPTTIRSRPQWPLAYHLQEHKQDILYLIC